MIECLTAPSAFLWPRRGRGRGRWYWAASTCPWSAVEFTTWTPHWFGAIDGPVELIEIFGAHGERVHLHA